MCKLYRSLCVLDRLEKESVHSIRSVLFPYCEDNNLQTASANCLTMQVTNQLQNASASVPDHTDDQLQDVSAGVPDQTDDQLQDVSANISDHTEDQLQMPQLSYLTITSPVFHSLLHLS